MLTKLVNPLFSLSLQGTRLTGRGYPLGIFTTPTRFENDSQNHNHYGLRVGPIRANEKIVPKNLV